MPGRFVDAELDRRRRFGSPPFGRLIKLTAALPEREAADATAAEMVRQLRARAVELGTGVAVLGPVPAYIARRGGRWRFHVVLRGPDPVTVLGGDPGSPLVGRRRSREPALGQASASVIYSRP